MWIIMVWQCISPGVTVKSFKIYCISNAVGETDEEMLWNGSEEDRNVRSECEGDAGTVCEDGDGDTVR